MTPAFDSALDEDLRAFLAAAAACGLTLRVTEEAGRQVVWAASAEEATILGEWYRQYRQQGLLPQSIRPWRVDAPATQADGRAPLHHCLLTLCLLVASVAVSLWLWFSGQPGLLAWLSFEPLQLAGGQVQALLGLRTGLAAGEYWRLLTPILLHFGWLHLVFNMLWLWEFGRRIEMRRGSLHFGCLVLLAAVLSNFAQYAAGQWSGDGGLFGGMSGVIYALIGYMGVWNWRRPTWRYAVPNGLFVFMIGWLLLCLSGLVTLVGFGRIANAAHVAGLLVGAAAAWLITLKRDECDGY